LKSNVKSYWNVEGGPIDAFSNDKKLDSVLRYRLGLNRSKPYSYVLGTGETVSCRETFDINIKNVRFGFIVQRNSVSWFKPSVAAELYKRFVGEIESPVVWDPSCGFSARMLGFSSVFDTGTYVACEPATMTHADAERIASVITASKPGLKIDVRKQGSEHATLESEKFDLVMTSPPYFAKEKWFSESGQCWLDYQTLNVWMEKYYIPTMVTAYNALKPSRYMVLNVSSDLEKMTIECAESVGFKHVDTLMLIIGRDHFSRKYGHTDNKHHEPVLVFQK